MRAKTLFSLVAISAGVLFAAESPEAFAKGKGGRKRGETVRLATPSGGATTNAKGTITITPVKGGQDAVLRLRGLDRRTTYQVVNGVTGDVLGTVRSNAKGKATFDLTPGVGKKATRAASTDGTGATDVPEVVDVVDPDTGDTVLTGDTTGDLQGLYGYATLGNATESVTITLGSDPFAEMEYFSFTYMAPPTDDGWYAPVFELYADTASGELPLGASSVLDLAGKDFQVRDADGNVVFKGSLPDVEAYDIPELPNFDDLIPTDDPNMGDIDWDVVMGDPSGELPFGFDDWMPTDDGSGDTYNFVFNFFGGDFSNFFGGDFGGLFGKRGARADEPTTDPVAEYTLWIESADGFRKAGDLAAPDWGGGCGDWENGWDDGWDDGWTDTWPDDSGEWADWDWDGTWDEIPVEDPATTNAVKRGARRNRR